MLKYFDRDSMPKNLAYILISQSISLQKNTIKDTKNGIVNQVLILEDKPECKK